MGHLDIGGLPVLPQSILALLRISVEDPAYYDRVVDTFRADPGLGSDALRFAQSAAVSPKGEVQSVQEAVLLVGARRLVGQVLRRAFLRTFVPPSPEAWALWDKASFSAEVAAHLALTLRPSGVDANVAHTAGLLHDLGQFALLWLFPKEYVQLLRMREKSERERQLERLAFGEDHVALGDRLARAWGFPEDVRTVIRSHHDHQVLDHPTSALVRIVVLADALWDLEPSDVDSVDRVVAAASDLGMDMRRDDVGGLLATLAPERALVDSF